MQQFTATGHYSDNSTKDLTTSAIWNSSSSAATIVAGLAKGVAAGSANITVTSGSVTSSPAAVLAVTASSPVLQSITVSPASASVTVGATQQFTATGHYSDNSTKDLTTSAIWNSSSSAATIVAGLAKGVAAGSANITVTSGSVISSPASVLAVTASPITITVSPTVATVVPGGTQQFTATIRNTSITALTWQVNGVTGGNATSGMISTTGSYTAPATVPSPASVTVTAVSQADSTKSASAQVTISAVNSAAFYVSTTGNDSNAGAIDSPWRTIQHAANSVQAGDTVYVRAGVYGESVNIAVSGSVGAGPITFQSYPGETAILDGTGLTVSGGTQGLFNIASQSYITIQGFEIRNYQTASASSTPAGIWVSGSGSNIQILSNIVHNIVTTSEKNGNAFGIAVYGTDAPAALDAVTIDGNQVYSLKTGNSESVNVDGNVTNFAITNNTIHDNDNIGIDAIGFEGVAPDPAYDYARNGEISGNTVYNISAINNAGEGNQYDADGIYVDGGSQITIERNRVYQTDLGIEVASEHSGHVASSVIVRNNLVYFSNSVGISIGGYASNVGGTDQCTIVNNTLFQNDTKNTGSGEFQVQYYATNNVFKNNIVYATSQGLFINNYTNSEPTPADVDYNVYFFSGGSSTADFLWNGTDHTGFSAFQSATGLDSHSQFADPMFLNSATPDLHVQATSPAVNRGINLGAVVGTVDLGGNPRTQGGNIDIGAYEQ